MKARTAFGASFYIIFSTIMSSLLLPLNVLSYRNTGVGFIILGILMTAPLISVILSMLFAKKHVRHYIMNNDFATVLIISTYFIIFLMIMLSSKFGHVTAGLLSVAIWITALLALIFNTRRYCEYIDKKYYYDKYDIRHVYELNEVLGTEIVKPYVRALENRLVIEEGINHVRNFQALKRREEIESKKRTHIDKISTSANEVMDYCKTELKQYLN